MYDAHISVQHCVGKVSWCRCAQSLCPVSGLEPASQDHTHLDNHDNFQGFSGVLGLAQVRGSGHIHYQRNLYLRTLPPWEVCKHAASPTPAPEAALLQVCYNHNWILAMREHGHLLPSEQLRFTQCLLGQELCFTHSI